MIITLLYLCLSILSGVLLIMSLTSIALSFSNYRHYAPVYRSLPNRKFYRNKDQIYSHASDQADDGFVWFGDDGHPCLKEGVYIHNIITTYFDPYSYYWLRKYQKWFLENINIENLDNYINTQNA